MHNTKRTSSYNMFRDWTVTCNISTGRFPIYFRRSKSRFQVANSRRTRRQILSYANWFNEFALFPFRRGKSTEYLTDKHINGIQVYKLPVVINPAWRRLWTGDPFKGNLCFFSVLMDYLESIVQIHHKSYGNSWAFYYRLIALNNSFCLDLSKNIINFLMTRHSKLLKMML